MDWLSTGWLEKYRLIIHDTVTYVQPKGQENGTTQCEGGI